MPVRKVSKSAEKVKDVESEDEKESDQSSSPPSNDENDTAPATQAINQNSSTKPPKLTPQPPQVPNSSKATITFNDDDGDDDDDDDQTSEDSENEDYEGEASREKKVNGHGPSSLPKPSQAVKPPPAAVYMPPGGFERLASNTFPNQQTRLPLTESSLAGKQLWHIIAPSSVPLSQTVSLPVQCLEDGGETAISHQGIDYIFVSGSTKPTGTRLLAPGTDGLEYQSVRVGFTKVLHLQQALPQLQPRKPVSSKINDASGSSSGTRAEERQVPETTNISVKLLAKSQPEGLRLRYKPPGFESAADTEPSSVESTSDTSGEFSDVEMAGNDDEATAKTTAKSGQKRDIEARGSEMLSDRSGKRVRVAESSQALPTKTLGGDTASRVAETEPAAAAAASSGTSSDTSSDGESETDSDSDTDESSSDSSD